MERIRRFFKRFGKGLKAKGYTLIEVAAVVAVTATLSAVVMPVVADKIAAAKLAAAQGDVNTLKDAIVNFAKDTGFPPFYGTITQGSAVPLPKYSSGTYFRVLASDDGLIPDLTSMNSAGWGTVIGNASNVTGGAIGSLDAQLVENKPGYSTLTTSAWKGPYIPSIGKDPWGNKYLAAVAGLAEQDEDTKTQKAVFVISAGPNGIVETNCVQPIKAIETTSANKTGYAFSPGGDDIIARVQ